MGSVTDMNGISDVAFGPDGAVVALGTTDGTLRVLEFGTGQPRCPPGKAIVAA
jgi:hypothetical protein